MINQVKTKKQLLKNENRYRLLLDTLEAGIIIHASDTSIITNNDRAAELLGLSNEQMRGKSGIDAIWNFVTEENIPCAVHEYPVNIIVNSKKPIKNHIFGIHQPINNNIVWVSVNGYPILDDKGDISEIIINFIDISERKKAEQELQKSEEKFRKIIETSPDGIAITSLDGTIQFVTLKIVLMWGYDVEAELLGRNYMEFVHPDYHEKAVYLITEMITGNLIGANEYLMVRKDGSTFHCEVNANIIRDANNVPTGILLIERDISERKLAEAALAHRNTELKAIYDLSPVMMCLVDTNRQIIFANLAFTELSGTAEEFLLGGHACGVFGCFNAIDDVRGCGFGSNCQKCSLRIAMEDTFKSGTVHKNVEFHTTMVQNGESREVLLLGSTSLILSNSHCNLLLCLNDISDLKQAEDKIHQKDIQLRKLSANLPDLMYQFTRRPDGSYFVPIATEGIKNIFGCKPEDVADNFDAIARVLHPDDAERIISDIEDSAKNLTYFTCEFRVLIPGRPVQWILSRSTPEKLPDGSITWYGFNANITERKQAELELISAKLQAEESDRLKSAFLANMSHEIRTPMNGILGFAELLNEPDLTGAEQQKCIDMIGKSGKRMLNIINDIVDISRIEAGLMKLDISESNVNEQIEYIYTFFKPEVKAKGITLSFRNSLTAKDAIIKTDREKLYAILTNLVKNAIKYTSEGSIEFGYSVVTMFELSQLQFYVKDTGIGIPKDRQEAIFERFVQADIADKMAYQGAGLGLSITKSYIEMLGGKIWVESEEGVGSAFYFTLP